MQTQGDHRILHQVSRYCHSEHTLKCAISHLLHVDWLLSRMPGSMLLHIQVLCNHLRQELCTIVDNDTLLPQTSSNSCMCGDQDLASNNIVSWEKQPRLDHTHVHYGINCLEVASPYSGESWYTSSTEQSKILVIWRSSRNKASLLSLVGDTQTGDY